MRQRTLWRNWIDGISAEQRKSLELHRLPPRSSASKVIKSVRVIPKKRGKLYATKKTPAGVFFVAHKFRKGIFHFCTLLPSMSLTSEMETKALGSCSVTMAFSLAIWKRFTTK